MTKITPKELSEDGHCLGLSRKELLHKIAVLEQGMLMWIQAATNITKQRDELLAALVKALPAIEEIRLVDLGALRDAENLGITSKINRARRELAERVEIINTINAAIAVAQTTSNNEETGE